MNPRCAVIRRFTSKRGFIAQKPHDERKFSLHKPTDFSEGIGKQSIGLFRSKRPVVGLGGLRMERGMDYTAAIAALRAAPQNWSDTGSKRAGPENPAR
jgi:hypothetical protein